jgi:hypothetical protein
MKTISIMCGDGVRRSQVTQEQDDFINTYQGRVKRGDVLILESSNVNYGVSYSWMNKARHEMPIKFLCQVKLYGVEIPAYWLEQLNSERRDGKQMTKSEIREELKAKREAIIQRLQNPMGSYVPPSEIPPPKSRKQRAKDEDWPREPSQPF